MHAADHGLAHEIGAQRHLDVVVHLVAFDLEAPGVAGHRPRRLLQLLRRCASQVGAATAVGERLASAGRAHHADIAVGAVHDLRAAIAIGMDQLA